jgi:hypothetical protein
MDIPPSNARRGLLKAGLGASVLFAPGLARVWAQSAGTLKLLQLPKIALVIGNSGYRSAPLRNPANDAKAISQALGSLGFAVTTRLDASRTGLSNAVISFVDELTEKKCVGLFYYAGHGIQLGWKNYLLPVDMQVNTLRDVPVQGVEVNALMQGLGKAGNALNVVILDACRDNPFGSLEGLDQKGLSQMDAPNQTLLAYATAPGNVASDGEGENGLYTENFLREIKVPEAKLEDVFKRVRLSVRLKSKGSQVPWESTSLEEDFWFIPPANIRRVTDSDRDRLYREQLAAFEKAKAENSVAAIEDFLRRYPNGNFSELAQLHLDGLLRRQGEKQIVIAPQEGNPYTKGSAVADTGFKVGDTYAYRSIDPISKVGQGEPALQVVSVESELVRFGNGMTLDRMGNELVSRAGRSVTPNQMLPGSYEVGRRWSTRYSTVSGARNVALDVFMDCRIVSKERITVPAGSFEAFRVERRGEWVATVGRGPFRQDAWMAPDVVRLPIATFVDARQGSFQLVLERRELVSFKQG